MKKVKLLFAAVAITILMVASCKDKQTDKQIPDDDSTMVDSTVTMPMNP